MREIKVRFEEDDLASLDKQASQRGVTRAQLIRERMFAAVGGKRFTPQDYNKLVADALRHTHGSLSRTQVESLVAFVFSRVAAGSSGS